MIWQMRFVISPGTGQPLIHLLLTTWSFPLHRIMTAPLTNRNLVITDEVEVEVDAVKPYFSLMNRQFWEAHSVYKRINYRAYSDPRSPGITH